jgi:hypothetical protein
MVDRHLVGKKSYRKGKDFEDIMRESWEQVPNSWRIRIKDGGGGESPADDLVLLDKFRLLLEYKSTDKKSFSISGALKTHQIYAGLAFMSLNFFNVSLIVINYESFNTVYIISMRSLFSFMRKTNKKSITIEEADCIGKRINLIKAGSIKGLSNDIYDICAFLEYL